MSRAARDRIKYPGGVGFPSFWSCPSDDQEIRTQPLVENILNNLGDIIDAIECTDRKDYSHIDWNQLSGQGCVRAQASGTAVITDCVVDQANSVSTAYSRAVKRHIQLNSGARVDLAASPELLELYGVFRGSPGRRSQEAWAKQVLERSLQDTNSVQGLIDLLERLSSNVASSYDAMFPCHSPDLTNPPHVDLSTVLPRYVLATASLSPAPELGVQALTLRPEIATSSRRALWWGRIQRRYSSS